MSKREHKTCTGLCSSFANPESHLTFMESTCSKKDLYQIPESAVIGVAACTVGGGVQGCGCGCVLRPWAKDLDFLHLSQPVK